MYTHTLHKATLSLIDSLANEIKGEVYDSWAKVRTKTIPLHSELSDRSQRIVQILDGDCECPNGASKRCIHIIADLIEYKGYSERLQQKQQDITCTSILCTWLGEKTAMTQSERVKRMKEAPAALID